MSKLTFYYKFKLIINKLSDDYRKGRESGKNWIFLFSQFWQHPIIFNPHDSNWKKNETLVIISLGFVQNRRYQIEMNKILFEYFIDSFTNISEWYTKKTWSNAWSISNYSFSKIERMKMKRSFKNKMIFVGR